MYKYSWFITRFNEKDISGDWYVDPKNALLMEDSNELTELGKLYNFFAPLRIGNVIAMKQTVWYQSV